MKGGERRGCNISTVSRIKNLSPVPGGTSEIKCKLLMKFFPELLCAKSEFPVSGQAL